jgi:23S rRNA pseudouridine2605 synthase
MPAPQKPPRPRVGLSRALSKLGVCSRSQAREWILAGRVAVNGSRVRDPDWRVDPDRDRIAVDGEPVASAARVYLMLNKPRGLVTTTSDERGRDTVYRCLDDPSLPWLSPVGRLDKASEGLLLFTNDSRWAARILDPESHLKKVYHVQVDRQPDDRLLRRMVEGVEDPLGERLSAARAGVLRRGERNAWLEVVLEEGKNRQIRRLLDALDVAVLRLVRVAIGPLPLGDLSRGAYRRLTPEEVRALSRG